MPGKGKGAEGRLFFFLGNRDDIQGQIPMAFDEAGMGSGDAGVGINRFINNGFGGIGISVKDPDALSGDAKLQRCSMLDLIADHGERPRSGCRRGIDSRSGRSGCLAEPEDRPIAPRSDG